jgi:chromosome segregation protein
VIRAGRLSELIYNGGREGKPARYCRVSLVFDNSDRTIPLDSDEVRLTRYVGLSENVEGGYNSYFYINGRKATLSDFDSLLAHAKISAEGYNIVQQGDVSRVVEMSPVERRRILEDIAGISRFDEDIRKAEEKRLEVEGNLDRIEIILGEIKRQLRQLQKDREVALRYREHKEALERARAQQAYREVQALRQQTASIQAQTDKYRKAKEKLREERSKLQAALKEADTRLGDLERAVLERGGEEFKELKERLDALRIERARCQDGIERSGEEAGELKAGLLKDREERQKLLKEIEGLETRLEEGRIEVQKLEASVEAKRQEIEELEGRASESDERVVELQKTLVALDMELREAEGSFGALSLEREKLRHRMNHLDEQIEQLKEESKAQEFEVQDAKWQLKEASSATREARKELGVLRTRHEKATQEEKELARQASELERAVKSLSREYSQLKAEAEAAENVQRGYNRAVAAILEARDTGRLKGIHGTIVELAQVKAEHEVALKVAAGARMQAIVVDDDSIAAHAIEYLKSKKLGRAIFLPLNKMVPGRPRGKAILAVRQAIGFAIDLVSFEERYRGAFWYVFGDTVVVKDLSHARRLMGGVRLVTLDGQLVEASGAMIGGQVDDRFLQFGHASTGRLAEVGKKLRRASQELKKLEDRLREVRNDREDLEGTIREVQERHDRSHSKTDTIKRRLRELEGRLETARRMTDEKVSQRDQTSREMAALEEQIRIAEERLEALRSRREAKRAEISEATPKRISSRLRELQAEKLTLVERLNERISRRETLESQIALLRERETELYSRIAEMEDKISEREEMASELGSRLSDVEEELLGLQNMEGRLLQQMQDIREDRDRAFQERTELEARLEKVAGKLETTEDFLLGMQAQLSSLEERLREAEARLEDLGPVEAEEIPPLEEIRATIARCERTLDSIGAVNLRALEDYEAQQERHDELKEELHRLKKERQNLLRLVGELETRKKEGLLRVFSAIRENFVEIFAELSEGGDAELLLEDKEDPFNGGLIIRARPPNKRFLRLEALSGGEKSLVSMAFIFAIQEFDPSPFYLLDEVDQNLDAVNAERIARMIRKNSASAQFIQISLRKVTLKEADHIIGVTMNPRGLSEVVMRVNLDELVEEPPTTEVAA